MAKNITIGGGTIGVGIKKGGIGAEISISSDGVRVGAGIGILEIDYNLRDGTGSVGWGFGVYEMVVSRKDCTFIKDFYIGGVYTHTEYQRDEKCDEDLPGRDKKKRDENTNTEENPDYEQIGKEMKDKMDDESINVDPDRFASDKLLLCVANWGATGLLGNWVGEMTTTVSGDIKGAWPALYAREGWLNTWIPDPAYWIARTKRSGVTFDQISGDGVLVEGGAGSGEIISTSLPQRGYYTSSFFRGSSMGGLFGILYLFGCYFGYWGSIYPLIKGSIKYTGSNVRLTGLDCYDENGLIPPRKLSPPPPPPPPMDCCNKLEKRLKRIEKTINTDLFVDKEGVKIPKNLFIPGGRGDTEITNYADYLATIIRIQAQSGIFPFSIEKKDINLVQSGNQSQTYYLPTATEAMKAVLENTIDNETKNDAILNLSVRIGIMVSKIVGKITFIEKTLQAISDFLGYPRREKIVRERIEVDPTLGARKQVGFRGFGPAPRNTNRKIEKQIELIRKKLEEGDKSLESALEDFLQPDDVAVRYEDFDDESGAPDLMELIDKGR